MIPDDKMGTTHIAQAGGWGYFFEKSEVRGGGRHLIPALGSLNQAGFHEFEASAGYKAISYLNKEKGFV